MIKLVKEQKKSQLKYYQIVLYTIKNLLPINGILKTLPSSDIDNYIRVLQRQRSGKKKTVKDLGKIEEDEIVLKAGPRVLCS